MKDTKMSPPWLGYYNKIKALFGKDEDIKIEFDNDEMVLKMFIDSTDKYEALKNLLPREKDFGGAVLHIVLVPANKDQKQFGHDFKAVFKGNPAVAEMHEVTGVFTNPLLYISFEKEVIQYYDDNIGDLHGNRSALLEDIAREVFESKTEGIYFCTDNKEELF